MKNLLFQAAVFISCAGFVQGQQVTYVPNITDYSAINGRYLSESLPVNTFLGTISAFDPDGTAVEYSISGNGKQYFAVDKNSGRVTLKEFLDFEKQSENKEITMLLKVEDANQQKSFRECKVFVLDENDELPTFLDPAPFAELQESAPLGTIVARVNVTDVDTKNTILSVSCNNDTELRRDACATFEIVIAARSNRDWNGYVQLQKELDYESRKSYVVPLLAFDGINVADVEVHIEVRDINDAPPKWEQTGPKIIDEEEPIGTFVQVVRANDQDESEKREIFYELTGPHTDVFSINSSTGVISNAVRLDFDAPGSRKNKPYDLTIKAREVIPQPDGSVVLGDDSLTTADISIKVTMRDINDNAPQFLKDNQIQTSYTVFIDENIASGQNIPGLLMTVMDRDQTATFNTFDLDTDLFKDIFQIQPRTDTASTSPNMFVLDGTKIDYEKGPRQYIIEVTAIETFTNPKFSSTTTVTINVRDVNDEAPVFDRDEYRVSISELSTANDPVVKVTATDNEDGAFGSAGIRYTLFGNIPEHFYIDEKTGLLRVKECDTPGTFPCIDYETKKEYTLSVSASDNNGAALNSLKSSVPVIVTILDENDNVPIVDSEYIRYIYEEQTVTINPLLLQAEDPDTVGGPLTYSITGDGSGLWQVTMGRDPNTNEEYANITAVQKIFFNQTTDKVNGEFRFDVVVSDQEKSSTANVIIRVIDINNNAPFFTPPTYTASLVEGTPGEALLVKVTARDLDLPTTGNGIIDFAIRTGGAGKFQLKNPGNESNGEFFVVEVFTTASATFDSGAQKLYNLTLECRDRGTPQSLTGTASVLITVKDTNNVDPIIRPTSKTINVREDTPIGTRVYQINAEDPDVDKVLLYYMRPESASQPNGADALKDFRTLFKVDELSGDVLVNGSLNRDEVAFITNELTVQDVAAKPVQTGTGALFIRITEYNDQDPKFSEPLYNVTIDEELTRNSFVVNIQCRDDDDKIAGYSIYQVSPRYPEYFSLAQDTGTLIVNERIDFEQIERITLSAECSDTGLPRRSGTSSIIVNIVNINDNTPIFEKDFYSAEVSEGNFTAEQYLLKVSATDIDKGDFGVVRYNVEDPFFRIDDESGDIYIVPGATFDREEYRSYGLQVYATDSPSNASVRRTAAVPVYISIEDINDNCPKFVLDLYSGVVPESANRETNVIDIVAEDADIGLNGRLFFTIQAGSGDPPGAEELFSIDSREDHGRLITATNLRDKVGFKRFNVTVSDREGQPGPDTCSVQVPVVIEVKESQNDAPEWIRPPRRDWVIYVLESQYEGMLVYNAKAKDNNTGPNGVVDYYFSVNNGFVSKTPEFRINRVTGVIRAEIEYDREQVDTYFLTLMARDRGNPAASSETTLTVVILDVDDNDPKFRMKDGVVEPLVLPPIKEGQAPSSDRPLGNCSFRASDADSDHKNNKIYYRLLTTNDYIQDYITVNAETCNIYLKKAVDFETLRRLEFDILAFNDKNDDTVKRYKREVNPSILPVVIDIEDENDNPPEFSQQTYLACASVDAPYRETILEVLATDPDSGIGSRIQYSLLNGLEAFGIHPTLGTIYNTISFRYATSKRQYTVNVQAADATMKATAKAVIFIADGSNLVKLKVNRPRIDVEPFKQQLISTIKASSNGEIDFACIDSINNHETDDGEETTAASDVNLMAVKEENGIYSIISSEDLSGKINDMLDKDDNKLTAIYVTKVEEKGESDDFELTEDAVLAIFIICLLLIILTIILLCLACYCIRNSKKKKVRKIEAKRATVPVANQPVETSFNPVYAVGNPESPPEYATVQKVRESQQPPIAPVVIAAPENLQPLPSEEPTNLTPVEPEEPEPTPAPEPEEPVPVIETEVLQDPVPAHEPRPAVFEHPEYEDRIETTIVEDEPVHESPPPQLDDQPSSYTPEDDPPLPSPPPVDEEIDVEIRDTPPASPASSRKGED